MKFGVAIFFTDYSIKPTVLARALEDRGFDSLWCPEHSHIPVSRVSEWPLGHPRNWNMGMLGTPKRIEATIFKRPGEHRWFDRVVREKDGDPEFHAAIPCNTCLKLSRSLASDLDNLRQVLQGIAA